MASISVGATGSAYTTPPITAADLGSSYSVVCRSDCDDVNAAASASITLKVDDEKAPTAAVRSPNGRRGLGADVRGCPPAQHATLTWAMSDNG